MEKSIDICTLAAQASNEFEINNTELKKRYIVRNIMLYNSLSSKIESSLGTFGTGYPFYALKKNLIGNLPVIEEQIRYNNELIDSVENSDYKLWTCSTCLSQNGNDMPDLKQICKPCLRMDNSLKPRKVINRLPDIDMWTISKEKNMGDIKGELASLFNEYDMRTSDVDPISTIDDIIEISSQIKEGIMPKKLLPIDAHIISYENIYLLIEKMPCVLDEALKNNDIPYLPIHPLSLRKTWQYDDTAYNFVHDYLSSFTDFNFKGDLKQILYETRNIIANGYSFEELYNFLILTGPDSVLRRHKTLVLKERFKERIDSWKK